MTLPEGRLCHDWLVSYLDLTANLEAPESLHLWTGLTLLSACVQRKVFISLEHGTVYPNLYVIIVAESAKVRKSTAMDFGRELLIEAMPALRIMRESMTSQGLIKSLNHKVQVVKDDKIHEELRSDVAIFADEVANLFSYERTRASQMVIFLTRTYTCPSVYDHTTVRDSTVRLHNLYPVLLGGTDPRNLKVLPDDAVGGLTGRLIWVIEKGRRANNPGWRTDALRATRRALLREYLIHDLQKISRLQGEMQVEPAGMELYNAWYDELSKREAHDPETDAFYHRCHTTALHIATLLSLAGRDDLTITARHVQGGIALVEQQLPEIKRVMLWSGGTQYEQQRAKYIQYLQSNRGVATRRALLHHCAIGSDDFDKLTATLVQDGTVELPPIRLKGEVIIKLIAPASQVQ